MQLVTVATKAAIGVVSSCLPFGLGLALIASLSKIAKA